MKSKLQIPGLALVLLAGCLTLTSCGGSTEASAEAVSDTDIKEAMACVLQSLSDGGDYSITSERTYQIYISGLSYVADSQTNVQRLEDAGYSESNQIYLQCDRVAILREGGSEWDSVVEYPGWGYWLVRSDSDSEWTIYGQGY